MRLKDKVAIVTGSGSGIGRATALECSREGATVIVCDLNLDAARETAVSIESAGGVAKSSMVDVTNQDQVNQMVRDTLAQFGKVDILINNVGGVPRNVGFKLFSEHTIDEMKQFFEINLWGTMICSKAVVNEMIGRHYGKIVNVSSFVAETGQYGGLPYATSKSAVQAFTVSLAKEVGVHGINVNCVMPGLAATPALLNRLEQMPERRDQLLSWSLLGRLGQPSEYGKAIVFLASDDASYVTGHTLAVEGGVIKVRAM